MELNYVIGDATLPVGDGNKIITHICNDLGGWGKGFVQALSKRWKVPEEAYRQWYQSGENFRLGEVQMVQVANGLHVANMIGQHGIYRERDGTPPIRYEALRECLRTVARSAQEMNASIHMPRIGAGLAGGDWAIIEQIVREELVDRGIFVTVYEWK